MTRSTMFAGLLMSAFAVRGAVAQDVSLTLHPNQVVNDVDVKVYGHFLEHIYHSCNGGLWGELIWNRSFEGSGAGEAWALTDDALVQQGGGTDVRLLFGEPTWSDYEFTVEARKMGGAEGFLILLRGQREGVLLGQSWRLGKCGTRLRERDQGW